MPQFKVVSLAFGPRNPGEPHTLLEEGTIVTLEEPEKPDPKWPGACYEALDTGGAAQSASPAAVAGANRRAARVAKDED